MDFAQRVKRFTEAEVIVNQPMKNYTGYGVGGNADYFVKIKSVKDLKDCVTFSNELNLDYKVIGKGSNLLFSDLGYRGVIIYTGELDRVYVSKNSVRCMAGARLKSFIEMLNVFSINALNALYGIPATIGGAVIMNAGCFGDNISEHMESVEVLRGDKVLRLDKSQCGFSYRNSLLKENKNTVFAVNFDLNSMRKVKDRLSAKEYLLKRKNIQPTGKSCGSVFKNPKGEYAGELIEKAGLKGYRIGGAKVSEVHANFIVTDNDATASDVFNLVEHVKKSVREKFKVNLTEEIEKVGQFDDINRRLSHAYGI